MKVVTLAAAAVALIGSTMMAFAATDTGTITSINWGLNIIVLDNGDTYVVPPSVVSTTPLSVGMKVKVTYSDKVATAVTKA